ncbi:hypothetical protein BESB_005440 [Besnoitia besnoiti]|uniref:Uncharacterized protein n=1 Tax=Besnoitia besnoiti TaxID=94643 RepID=A0A2A9MPZ5_BESBE|nr:hypothetical protein BESB_005440 [Besnoitia besnoiti]PFH38203.1 hypothetical protein BESB_005440 [Besnoitia besnoiti]
MYNSEHRETEVDPLSLAAVLLKDRGVMCDAEACIEALRAWRTSEESNLQQQLEDIDRSGSSAKSETDPLTLELDGLLARGSGVVARVEKVRMELEREIEEIHSSALAAQEAKLESFRDHLETDVSVPSIADLTEEVLRMEGGFLLVCMAMRGMGSQYCCDIDEALEEATKTERVPELTRIQEFWSLAAEDSGGGSSFSRPTPRREDDAASRALKSIPRDGARPDSTIFLDSVLLQCAEVGFLSVLGQGEQRAFTLANTRSITARERENGSHADADGAMP